MITRNEISISEKANAIAAAYLQKNPRKQSYLVQIGPSEMICNSFYMTFTDKEMSVLRNCIEIANKEWDLLSEILHDNGHDELLDRIYSKLQPTDDGVYIETVDFNDSYKTTTFGFRECLGSENLGREHRIEIPLTDDEYQELLAEHIRTSNHYSMNMLAVSHPEICKTIMDEVLRSTLELFVDRNNPFIMEFVEHKAVCESILSSSDDLLEGNDSEQ